MCLHFLWEEPHPHSASEPLILLRTRSLCGAEFIPLQQGSHFPQTTSSGHRWAPQLASSTRGLLQPSTGGAAQCGPLGGVEVCSSALRSLI